MSLRRSLDAEAAMLVLGMKAADRIPIRRLREQIFAENERALSPLLRKTYSRLIRSAAFNDVYSEYGRLRKAIGGFVSYPRKSHEPSVNLIVFFHGAGGNGAWNIATARRMFPDALIAAPTMGIRCKRHDCKQVVEWLRSVEARFAKRYSGTMIACTNVIALSQGIIPATSLLNDTDYPVQHFTMLSTFPAKVLTKQRANTLKVSLITGKLDERCDVSGCKRYWRKLVKHGFNARLAILKEADHFMLLSHTRKVTRLLRSIDEYC